MPYDHQARRFRIVFEDPDPLSGLVMVVRAATVDDYVRIGALSDGVSPESVDALCEAMGPMLVEWDLTQDGVPVPANAAGLRSLEVPLAVRLSREWLATIGSVPAPLERPSQDGEIFQEGSLVMEALSESLSS